QDDEGEAKAHGSEYFIAEAGRSGTLAPERRRGILLRVPEDLQDGVAVGSNEAGGSFVGLLPPPGVPQPGVHRILWPLRHAIETRTVNHVAARGPQQAVLQVEIVERTAHAVARAERGKLLGETRRALHRVLERYLVDEQHVVDQIGCGFAHAG